MIGGKVRRTLACSCAAVAFAGVFSPEATAGPTPALVSVADSQITFAPTSNGDLSGTAEVLNLTQSGVGLSIKPLSSACVPLLDSATNSLTLNQAQQATVTITIPKACSSKVNEKTTMTLTAKATGKSAMPIVISVAGASPEPDWNDLWCFAGGLSVAALIACIAYRRWRKTKYGYSPAGRLGNQWNESLKGLGTSWSFGTSWASNVTAGGGLVVAIVGSSDFLNAVLSDKATTAISIATVAGLIAAALVATAGVCTAAVRKPDDADPTTDITVLGFLLGTIGALGAAMGEVFTITVAVVQAGASGPAQIALWVGASLVVVLLGLYGITSIVNILYLGLKMTPKQPQTHCHDKVAAATQRMNEQAQKGHIGHNELVGIFNDEFPAEPDYEALLRAQSALP